MSSKNTWRIHVPKRVSKTIGRFPKQDWGHILDILRDFEVDPWSGDIAKIKGEINMWRRQVGNYRVFYSVDVSHKIVEVKEIERRTSATY